MQSCILIYSACKVARGAMLRVCDIACYQHAVALQVTTDWLTTDMQEGLLDEKVWKELVADCGLDPCERPQVTVQNLL